MQHGCKYKSKYFLCMSANACVCMCAWNCNKVICMQLFVIKKIATKPFYFPLNKHIHRRKAKAKKKND